MMDWLITVANVFLISLNTPEALPIRAHRPVPTKWVENTRLCDLNFAADVVLTNDKWDTMQDLATTLETEACKVE